MALEHEGPHTLPNFPLFSRLLSFAHRDPGQIAIRDVHLGFERSYLELLTDVLSLRRILLSLVPTAVLARLNADKETYVGVLAAGGYEYTVAVIAIIAIGAAVVPMSNPRSFERNGNF